MSREYTFGLFISFGEVGFITTWPPIKDDVSSSTNGNGGGCAVVIELELARAA